jgi:hypothetical protein
MPDHREKELAALLQDDDSPDSHVHRDAAYLEDLQLLFPFVHHSLSAAELVGLLLVVERARRWKVPPARIVLDALHQSQMGVLVGAPS